MDDRPDRPRAGARTRTRVVRVDPSGSRDGEDWVATEEPLEIRLAVRSDERFVRSDERFVRSDERVVAVTMRTPGNDWELAAGFLYTEGLIRSREDVASLRYCADDQRYNVVTVDLTSPQLPDLAGFERYGSISSACGVCGKTSLDQLERQGLRPVPPAGIVDVDLLRRLPGRLRAAQRVFDATGGLHAAALFDPDGELVAAREDVGRHNALDKLVGWALLEGRLPLSEGVVLVSGRASFELVQKCVAAGATCLAAVSAPSSLAIDAAQRFGLTLVGFLRDGRANVYTGAERVVSSERGDTVA